MQHSKATVLAAAAVGLIASGAMAADITLTPNYRGAVDEQPPRVAFGDAPNSQFGVDSWMNSATGKVNAYISDDGTSSDGVTTGAPSLFDRAVTVGEVTGISYYTKDATVDGDDPWFVNFYTQRGTGTNDASWYGKRFTTVVNTSTTTNDWMLNEVTGFRSTSGSDSGTLYSISEWRTTFGGEGFGLISPQTNSGDNGSDAQFDGLIVFLDSETGSVNFEAAPVPEPMAAIGGLGMLGLVAVRRRARTSA